jgi:hypothetical protein
MYVPSTAVVLQASQCQVGIITTMLVFNTKQTGMSAPPFKIFVNSSEGNYAAFITISEINPTPNYDPEKCIGLLYIFPFNGIFFP